MTTIEQGPLLTIGALRAREVDDRIHADSGRERRGVAGRTLPVVTMIALAFPATGLLAVLAGLAVWPLASVLSEVVSELLP